MTRRFGPLRAGIWHALLASASVAIGISAGCWAGPAVKAEMFQVDLKGCEMPPTGRMHEKRNENCCRDWKWEDSGLSAKDSLTAFRVGIGADPQWVEVQSLNPDEEVALRLVSGEDSLLYQAFGRTDKNGLIVFRDVVVKPRAWLRDGYYYLVVTSSRGCFKHHIFIHS